MRRLLGDPAGGEYGTRRTWVYGVGWTNDLLGPGDGQDLLVRFDGDRVRRARLLFDR